MKLEHDHHARLRDILEWRRDIRHFRTEPVDPAALAKVEAAVDYAPSVGNSRPWRMVRVIDDGLRQRVAENFRRENERAAGSYDGERQRDYRALKLAGLREAPVHYAVFCDPEPEEGCGLGRRTMPETVSYSAVMAVHTLWLAARALNIGVGWVSILEPAEMNGLLGVPDRWRFIAYLCVGYPVEEHRTPELERRGWQAGVPTVWIDR